MTYRMRGCPSSPEYSGTSSATDKRDTHEEEEDDEDGDYTEASRSQSKYEFESEQNQEEEALANPHDSAFAGSGSVNNAQSDRFSLPLSKSELPVQAGAWTASYRNVAPLPVFHGGDDECPLKHLSRFVKVCRANNAPSVETMARIFPVTLEDEAALWYDLNVEPYPLSWEEIKSSFLEAYRRNDLSGEIRSGLATIKQGEKETVRSYFLRLQWEMKKWPENEVSANFLRSVFIAGLREDFQDWIVTQKPNSLDDALRLSFNWEQLESVRSARKRKCGFCEGAHEEAGCEVRERMKELWLKEKQTMGDLAMVGRGSSVFEKAGDGEDEKKRANSQCQCWKHQCWKKKLERSKSLFTGNPNTS